MKKIYVIVSSKFKSGGTESLHQLVDCINRNGGDASLYFFDSHQKTIDSKFEQYEVKIVSEIEDVKDNIVIIPETLTFLCKKIKKCKVIIWWLSLDFYVKTKPVLGALYRCKKMPLFFLLFPGIFFYLLINRRTYLGTYNFSKKSKIFHHLYNCEYVHQFLKKKGISENNMSYLCGPIESSFLCGKADDKEDIVLYSPAKGMEFTKKIIKELNKNNIKHIALENMSRNDVVKVMQTAKVYMDFGFFPGPERIPREAVMLYCNLITANVGSAANVEDIPIDHEFKFNRDKENIEKIVNKIICMFNQYYEDIYKFDKYRDKVRSQEKIFEITIKKLLEIL